MVKRWSLLILALVSLLTVSAGKKSKIFITFHIEAEESEGGKFVIPITIGEQVYFFRKVPEISNKQINSFYRFPAKDGKGSGVAFKLDSQGSSRLASITSASVGKRLLTVINLRPVNFVMVDKPIRHGYAVVWNGITDKDMALIAKEIPETAPGESFKKDDNLSNDDFLRRDADDAYDIGEKEKKKKPFRLFGRREKSSKNSDSDMPLESDFAPVPD